MESSFFMLFILLLNRNGLNSYIFLDIIRIILSHPCHLGSCKILDDITVSPVSGIMVIDSADDSSEFRICLNVV